LLIDHDDQYLNILTLINQTENNLWKYSAKIFSLIVRKLDLLSDIESSYNPLPDESGEINQLDEHLSTFMQSQFKIHRLFVNRIHLDLILSFHIDNNSIKSYLNEYYENFKNSIEFVTTSHLPTPSEGYSHVQLIRILSWLKYYSQLYSFSLVNNLRFQYSNTIDQYLTDNKSSFCSTLKLFILKQILNLSKMDLNTFQTNIEYQNIIWLNEFSEKFQEEKSENKRNIILPIPFIEAEDEYSKVNKILSNFTDEYAINKLILSCSTNQYLSYCFYLWFIKYYTQYSNKNFQSNDQYRFLFQINLSNESKKYLQPIGIQFLHMLCTNFSLDSYFQLNSSMSDRDIVIRIVILNIFALTLSFKSFDNSNWINTILFDTNFQMPTNYFEHLQTLCLFGLIDNNRIKSNMKYVQKSIKQRLNSGHLSAAGRYIYQCSEYCLYLYHFSHCGIPNQKSVCPFCQKEIGSSKYGVLLDRNPPQIKMTIEEGLQLIKEYIDKCNRENKLGYYGALSSSQSTLEQKSDHLNSSITFRFLHLFIHSILFILKEFNYLSNENLEKWDIFSDSHFQDHVQKDYELLEKCIPDSEYCYVWLFQILNGMLSGFLEPLGILDSKEKVIKIEKLIEEQLIIPHTRSKIEEINNYKRTYIEYTEKEETDNILINFLDERTENDRRYPFLNFFNVTQIFNQNQIEEFLVNLKTTPHARTNYPLTMYLLEQIDQFSNIQYLYPIMQFINYLRDKYNYRISRQKAISKSIHECLDDKGEDLFKKYSNAWSKINLNEVRHGCQVRTFDRHMNKDKKLAFFSLNISKDDSSLILSATLQTIAELQNKIVNFFHNEIIKSTNIHCLPIHMIEREHLLHLDTDFIKSKIIKHALVINFQYGQSKDIIYDYEEIEITLRSLINRLPLINIEKFRKIHYQFELYSENNALINDVRRHIEQKQINIDERRKYQYILENKDETDIYQYLGSLDFIFTYIQNRNYRSNISTIELFVNEYIHSKNFLNQNLLLQSIFASIKLEYIIDLYELIEEIAFDKIFRNYIERKLNDQTIDNNQRIFIQNKFLSMTIDNKQIATSLRNIPEWITILKRFMVRILQDYVDLNIPIEIYLKRIDLWNCQITEEDIETIQLDDTILLKHTFIILIGLENRLNETNEQQTTQIILRNSAYRNDETDSFKPQRKITSKKQSLRS
jgi:hypothetical protein